MKYSLGISNFLEEKPSPSHSIVFLYFFALITEEGFLISLCYSLELCIQMLISSFSPLLFTSLLFTAISKASSGNCFALLHFFCLGMVLITAFCTVSRTSIHSSSGTLSHLIPWMYFSLPLYYHKGFDLSHTWMISGFPHFLQFESEFGNRSSWSEPQSAPGLVFADYIELLHFWLQRI